MQIGKYKVGDKVIVLDGGKIEHYCCGWISGCDSMSKYIGTEQVISEVKNEDGKTYVHFEDIGFSWDIRGIELVIEPKATQQIIIFAKGTDTIAILKNHNQVIKRAVAKLNPQDTYSFEKGVEIAFNRLMGLEVKEDKVVEVREVKRRANVGEFVRITNASCCEYDEYKNGDILQIVESPLENASSAPYYKKKRFKYLNTDEYVVLENYTQPVEKPIDLSKVSSADLFAEVERRIESCKKN